MANAYAEAQDVIARVPGADIVVADEVLEVMSRWADGFCHRKFWLDPTATDRVFAACHPYMLDLGGHEIGELAGVVVKTDDGSGAFATTIAPGDYQPEPINAPFAATGPAPYTRIRLLSGSWPRAYTAAGRHELVKVTARYGWPAVPLVVRESVVMLAADNLGNPSMVRTESIDGYSVTYGAVMAARTKLSQFRKLLVA